MKRRITEKLAPQQYISKQRETESSKNLQLESFSESVKSSAMHNKQDGNWREKSLYGCYTSTKAHKHDMETINQRKK